MSEIVSAPGVYVMPAKVYHADPCPSPSLSSGIAKKLIARTPSHAWTDHPRCPWFKDKNKQQWDLGGATHDILLEGEEHVVVVKADSYRSDAAKSARDLAYARGQVPILPHQLEEAREFVEAIRAQIAIHQSDSDAFTDGKPELTYVWQDVGGIWCRARADWTPNNPENYWTDFKTTETSVNPDTVGRWASDQGHAFQAAFYTRGIKAVTGNSAKYRFVVAENYPPYALLVYTIPKELQEAADQQVELAMRTWADCLENQRWPGYPPYRVELDVPPWAKIQWETRRERAKFENARTFDPVLARMLEESYRP